MPAILVTAVGGIVVIVLTGVSIYSSVLSSQFFLPTPTLGHVLSIFLPVATLAGLLFPPNFLAKTLIARQQAAVISVLGLFDTVLVTLASTLLQPSLLSCELERRWHTLFEHHDRNAIRHIQDAMNCCGLRTVLDRPWPFPDNHGAAACRDNLGRERSCEAPWTRKEVQVLAIWIVVGVLGLVVKAIFILGQRNRPARVQNESARNRHYFQGRIIDNIEGNVEGGRFLDQPSEETPLRSGEGHIEHERTN